MLSLIQQLFYIQMREEAVVIEHPSVHHGHHHIAAAGGIDKVIELIMHRPQIRRIEIQHRDISLIALLETTAILPPLCQCSGAGSGIERLRRGNAGRIAADALVNQRESLDLFQHIEIIIAGDAIRTQSHVNAGG